MSDVYVLGIDMIKFGRFPDKSVPQLGAVLILLLSCQGGGAQEYQVDLTRENQVSFLSDAPLEDFEGVTDRVDGFVFLEGEGLVGGTDLAVSEFFFEVDLASLDTGLGLRNRHMRENYLETEEYPFASFSGRIQALERTGDGGFSVRAKGELSIHGVNQTREIGCRLARVGLGTTGSAGQEDPGEQGEQGELEEAEESEAVSDLRVQCAFPVSLSDHGIPIPKLMFMKIDEVMELELDFYLKAVSEEVR